MNWSEIDRRPAARKVRQFAVLWLLVLGSFGAWRWLSGDSGPGTVMAVLGLAGGVIGLWKPALFRPVFVGLTIASFPIGWIVSRAILAIVFYGVLTPIGLTLRLIGADPMQRRRRSGGSHWISAESGKKPASYLHQF